MDTKITNFLSDLDQSGEIQNEIESLIQNMKSGSHTAFELQSQRLENCLLQLAEGKITASNFEDYVLDIKENLTLKGIQASVKVKQKGEWLAQKVVEVIIKRLIVMIIATL
jgi:hypothetical protein